MGKTFGSCSSKYNVFYFPAPARPFYSNLAKYQSSKYFTLLRDSFIPTLPLFGTTEYKFRESAKIRPYEILWTSFIFEPPRPVLSY